MSSAKTRFAAWLRRKVIDPLMIVVKRGAEPKQLALSGAVGITLGVFPICGVTVLLCGVVAAIFGSIFNTPTLMLANFIATPIELSLVLPFLRLGELISGGEHLPLGTDALKKVLTGQASYDVLLGIFHAILGWIVASPFILFGLYVIFIPCFKLLVHKFAPPPASPKKPPHSQSELKPKIRSV